MRIHATLAFAVALLLGMIATSTAEAQTFTVLYNFTGGDDGGFPVQSGPLVRVSSGDLFGATNYGGANNSGTLFKLSGNTLTTLHSFFGKAIAANVILDSSGTIYGTTEHGGTGGCGTVYKFANLTLRRLHNFTCGSDGGYPFTTVIRDKQGNLYGTTSSGGSTNCPGGRGVLYQISASGVFTVIHMFCSVSGCPDGQNPSCNLILDHSGNLYGMTSGGGTNGLGTVFQLSRSGTVWKERVLHNFDGGAYSPNYGGLTMVTQKVGNKTINVFFGVTEVGGGAGCRFGCGTAFEMIQAKTGYKFTILHSFTGSDGGDGAYPVCTLTRLNGKLFGTTFQGGIGGNCAGGCGIVFELSQTKSSWRERILHNFTGGTDGGYAYDGVVADHEGKLYGDTQIGGVDAFGVVYEVTP